MACSIRRMAEYLLREVHWVPQFLSEKVSEAFHHWIALLHVLLIEAQVGLVLLREKLDDSK